MTSSRSFAPLVEGDCIAVIAPAGVLGADRVAQGVAVIEAAGFVPVVAPQVYEKVGRFAGQDDDRLKALHTAFEDPAIKAIVCTRGGYGVTRFLDQIDLDLVAENPKPLLGYSDISALHVFLQQRVHLPSLYGPMLADITNHAAPEDWDYLFAMLKGHNPQPADYRFARAARVLQTGEGSGVMLGGNLAVLAALCGTQDQPSFNGKIALIEELGEPLYRIDRMLDQLHRAGAFFGLKGLILGEMVKVEEPDFGQDLDALFVDSFARYHPDIPIIANYPAGHGKHRLTLPFGVPASLQALENGHIALTHTNLFTQP